MRFEMTGRVDEVCKVQTFSSGFTKRDIIVDTAEAGSKYPNPVCFSFKKDHVSELDGIKVGQTVTVKFVIDGRKWDGPKGVKYFNDLTGLRIAVEGATNIPAPAEPPSGMAADVPEDNEEMPF